MATATVVSTSIIKHQKWNAKVMASIWAKRKELDAQQVASIQALYDNAKKHNRYNVSTITYQHSKKSSLGRNGYGRLYGSEKGSMERLEKTLRHSLCAGIYWDIDMANAQPTILSQMATKRGLDTHFLTYYIEHREDMIASIMKSMGLPRKEVKEWFIKCIFGCKISALEQLQTEMRRLADELRNDFALLYDLISKEKEKNIVGSFMAYVAQTEECRCMRAMDDFFSNNGRVVGVLSYDGCLVYTLENETEFPTELLRGCERYIKRTCGYDISLVVKEMKCSPDYSGGAHKLLRQSDVDDVFMTRKFIEKMEGRILHDRDHGIMLFDESTGLWSADKNDLRRAIVDANLVEDTMDGPVNYSGFLFKQNNIIDLLPSLLIASPFFDNNIDNSIGKLLFSDGIYDMRSQVFSPGFNKSLVFSGRIGRPFPKGRNEGLITDLNKLLFSDPFYASEQDVGVYLKQLLARGIAGEYRDKVSIWAVGETNSGKGVQSIALMKCFESFISIYNPNALLYNKNSGSDEAKKLAWVYPIHNSRIAIGNEVRPSGIIDSSIVKQVVSGGDPMKIRKNFKDEEDRVVRATIMYMCNDMAKFDAVDNAVVGRVKLYEYKISFVDKKPEDLQEWERAARPVKELFDRDEYKDAYFWCIMDAYLSHRPVAPSAALASADVWLPKPRASFQSCLQEAGFQIVKGNDELFVPFSELKAVLVEGGVARGMTDQAIGRELNKLGLISHDTRVNGRVTKIRKGITRIQEV